jgi:hypothetical protein
VRNVAGYVLITTVLLSFSFASTEGRANNPLADQRVGHAFVGQPPAIWSRLSERLRRRAACNQQAKERGLSGRPARRFTRLCLSGLPVPEIIRRSP